MDGQRNTKLKSMPQPEAEQKVLLGDTSRMNSSRIASFPNCKFFLLLCMLISLAAVSCTKAPQVARPSPPKPVIVEPPPKPELTTEELWQQLVFENRYSPVDTKLTSVNTFFNQFEFVEDMDQWGREDYWATLFETLRKNGGDCEDLTIAKYFTLKDLNVPDENMRLTYVISVRTRKPHIVLTFQRDAMQEPLVLDTMNNYLFPVSRRNDLVPVYSFNEYGYWLARKKDGWQGERLGSPARLTPWWSMLTRMKMSQSKKLSPVTNYYR